MKMDKNIMSLIFSLFLLTSVRSAELMGGHYDNVNENYQRENETTHKKLNNTNASTEPTTEELIPDPSALIIAGYNLPGHLFNDGKPFYVEKDPLTGVMNFNNKTPAGKEYNSNDYEYIDEEPNPDIFDKSNIDRKDGGYGSHRPNDVNQLSPNFHDFLNLPVKYNTPEKYVYPLISSSYANTKIQGHNVNSYNHKQYSPTTYKPTVSPTYYTTKSHQYYKSTTNNKDDYSHKKITTTGTPSSTNLHLTTEKPKEFTKPTESLLNSPMNHPSYYITTPEYDYDYFTTQNVLEQTETTETPHQDIYKKLSTTTKKPYSFFDELFGDYEEEPVDDKPIKPTIFSNFHSSVVQNKENKVIQVTPSSVQTKSTTVNTPSTTTRTTTDKSTSVVSTTTQKLTSKKPSEMNFNANYENIQQVFPEDNNMYEYVDDYVNDNEEHVDEFNKTTDVSTQKSVVISIRNDTNQSKNINNTTEEPASVITTTIKYSDRFHSLPSITTEHASSANDKTTQEATPSTKVTSMPLGENHPRLPVITLTQNLKESLNREKVESSTKVYQKPQQPDIYNNQQTVLHHIPSTSNIRIAPDQDMVSFVVGNHQNVDGGHYVGTALKEEAYISNSFRPLYTQQQQSQIPIFDQVVFNQPVKATLNYGPPIIKNNTGSSSSTINVQPIIGSQASLSIGMPAELKKVKGEVMDEKLDLNENIEYPKESGTKVVFPEEDLTTYTPPPRKVLHPNIPQPTREILSLYSKPMSHQLPSDLTPPSEPEVKPLRPAPPSRPPWDPRPGHFYQGRPEYARPPRPHKPEVYKRIDGLPNILPQFRPNAKVSNGHYMDQVGTINAGYMPRQPLLDRPSNRPIGFFEKLHPPPPPKRMHDHRKVAPLENENKHDRYRYEERILNVPNMKGPQEHFGGYQLPPKAPVANRKTEDESEISTLQMIQAKHTDKLESIKPNVPPPFKINYQETTEKPLYVVYPVNSSPLKLDVLDNDKRETVVVGTRGEQMPLPPSKINQEQNNQFDQKPLLKPKDRNDSPILKPHTRPNNYPVKSDFPYNIEKPDPTLINNIPISSITPEPVPSASNMLDTTLSNNKNDIIPSYQSNNQWNTLETESRIINGNKHNLINDQISATLKTFTEKPIAIAYTPTEPNNDYKPGADKFSIPNFGRPVISEIRPESNKYGTVNNEDSEFTVSAVMHTHPQMKLKNEIKYITPDQKTITPPFTTTRRTQENLENHKLNLDIDSTHIPTKLDFQAPFHASVSIDSEYQGWSVVNQNAKSEIDRADVDVTPTNLPETSSEFDIENFKPQLFGGFKPIYNFSNEKDKQKPSETEQEV